MELEVHQTCGGTRSTPNLLKTIQDGGGMVRRLPEHRRRGDDDGLTPRQSDTKLKMR